MSIKKSAILKSNAFLVKNQQSCRINKKFFFRLQFLKNDFILLGIILLLVTLLQIALLLLSTSHDLDFYRFLNRSSMVLDGNVPFSDFSDPKPLWTYTLATWIYVFGNGEHNALIFLILIGLMTIVTLFFIGKQIYGIKGAYTSALLYGLAPFTLLFSSVEGKMDMIPLLFVLLSFYLLLKKHHVSSAIFMGIGISYKYLAGLLLIPFIIFIIRNNDKKTAGIYLLGCLITAGLITLPFTLISLNGFIEDTLLFFITRGNNGYSIYHPYTFLPFYIPLVFVLIAFFLLTYYTFTLKEIRPRDITKFAFFFVMIINIFNRVLFTQYLIYAMPFLSLYMTEFILEKQRYWALLMFAIPAALGIELLNNFGLTIVETASITGDISIFTYLLISFVTFYFLFQWDKKNSRTKKKVLDK
jgi:uncharacterized membrane protein